MLSILSFTAIQFVFWLLLSGHYEPMFYAYGAGSCLFVSILCYRMGVIDEEGLPLHVFFGMITYFPWLMFEIIKSNFHVARVILNYKMPIDPKIIKVTAEQKTDLGKVIYANSITLTPGTISMNLYKNTITVHALTSFTKDGVEDNVMNQRVCKIQEAI